MWLKFSSVCWMCWYYVIFSPSLMSLWSRLGGCVNEGWELRWPWGANNNKSINTTANSSWQQHEQRTQKWEVLPEKGGHRQACHWLDGRLLTKLDSGWTHCLRWFYSCVVIYRFTSKESISHVVASKFLVPNSSCVRWMFVSGKQEIVSVIFFLLPITENDSLILVMCFQHSVVSSSVA